MFDEELQEFERVLDLINNRFSTRSTAVLTRDEFGTLADAYMCLRAYHKSFKEAQE
ncbi:MAG: hypothetical protein Tp1111DCM1126091_42 [Prokaryotic dsDNA virus sp.]|mgnify:CR=1 FL=1|nr:MAG: hypothetical protein Tp1111DCM1126091_42 [Prokaryotic dsDNA virus sp.]